MLNRDIYTNFAQCNFEGQGLFEALIFCRKDTSGEYSFAVKNLLNEHYISYYSQTLNYVNDTTYFAGRGRAFTARWEKSF